MSACPSCGVEVSEENLGFHFMVMHKGSYPPGSEPPTVSRVSRRDPVPMAPQQAHYLINTLVLYGAFAIFMAAVLWGFAFADDSFGLKLVSAAASVPAFFVFLAGVVGKMVVVANLATRPSN